MTAGTAGRVIAHARNHENRRQQHRKNRSSHVAMIGALYRAAFSSVQETCKRETYARHTCMFLAQVSRPKSHCLNAGVCFGWHTRLLVAVTACAAGRCHTTNAAGRAATCPCTTPQVVHIRQERWLTEMYQAGGF